MRFLGRWLGFSFLNRTLIQFVAAVPNQPGGNYVIIKRITQFFYLAAVHEQGLAQRNHSHLNSPPPTKSIAGNQSSPARLLVSFRRTVPSQNYKTGSGPGAAWIRPRDAPRGRRPVRRGNAECGCRRPGSSGHKTPRRLHRLGLLFPAIPQHIPAR